MTTRLDELANEFDAREAARKSGAQANIDSVLAAIFEEIGTINRIRIQGWTMGFNDGDPCYHSQAVAVGGDDEYDLLDGEDRDEVDEALATKAANLLASLEGDFEIVYDTNWTLDIVRDEGGGYQVNHSDYDCGY